MASELLPVQLNSRDLTGGYVEVRFRRAIALGVLGISLNPLLGLSAIESPRQAPATETDTPKSASKDSGSSHASNGTVPDRAKSDGISETAMKKAGDQTDSAVYRIGIEDDLLISVWKEPDLSTAVVVRPDGMITLPLLNDIQVVGLQTSELQALLTERLKPYVNEPQVTVIVRGIKSRKVYVYGQVAKAGAYLIIGRKTVLEILADAGGLSPFAKKGSIYVMRNRGGKQSRIPFNYGKALKGEKPSDNFELLPGDIVVVP